MDNAEACKLIVFCYHKLKALGGEPSESNKEAYEWAITYLKKHNIVMEPDWNTKT